MTTTVVNIKRNPEYDVFIGRPSKWGNPFKIGPDGDRKEVIRKYRAWIMKNPRLLASLGELRGKRLGCFCKPLACHGDVLAALADRGVEEQERPRRVHRDELPGSSNRLKMFKEFTSGKTSITSLAADHPFHETVEEDYRQQKARKKKKGEILARAIKITLG